MMGVGPPNPNGTRRPITSIVPTIGGPIRPFMENRLDPQWSPDGDRLLFFSLIKDKDVMYVADREGANPREVFPTAAGEHTHYMGWSASGRSVYFTRATRSVMESDIWQAPASGGVPERITHHNAWTASPTALDDRTLLYIASDENNMGTWLYAMDLDRREEHRLSVGIEQYSSIAASAPGRGGHAGSSRRSPTRSRLFGPFRSPTRWLRSRRPRRCRCRLLRSPRRVWVRTIFFICHPGN
jgi:WD40-like Beta Propeller Repeat